MQRLRLIKKILASSILLPITVVASPIGDITEQTGVGSLTRERTELVAEVGRDIELYDTLNTGNGRIAVEFVDNAELRLTEHSRVLIDEVIWIETPTATIGIRGTDFTATVDELGRSLIILLPDLNGNASGEITVTNEGGVVTLNEAYQATMVSTISTPPVKPVTITNITVAQIDNLFIVSAPTEVQQAVQEEANENSKTNVFTADFLEFNELEKDHLDKRELEYRELDMDLLDVDFLQDMLAIIEEADLLQRKKGKSVKGFENVNITGTNPGFDKESQYNTIVDDSGQIWFYRQVTGIISIRLPIEANASISTITDEKESLITVNDGYAINIIITQVN